MISAFGVEHVISKSLKPEHVAVLRRAAKGQKAAPSQGHDLPYANTDVKSGETGWARGRLMLRDLGEKPGGPNTASAKTVKQGRTKMKRGLSMVKQGQYKRSQEFNPSGFGTRRKPGWTDGPGGNPRRLP